MLYLVRHETDDGDNFDLLVRAESRDRAIRFWREYFTLTLDAATYPEPDRIDPVPDEPREGAISWEHFGKPVAAKPTPIRDASDRKERFTVEFDVTGEFTRAQLREGMNRCLKIGMDEGLYSEQADDTDAGVTDYRITD